MSFTPSPLVTVDGVQAYLADTPFASHNIIPLSGGTANFAYRIHLLAPFDGQETLVLKFAEPYIKSLRSIPFSVDRQTFEYEAMTRVKAWLPADSLVAVPKIYKFDADQHVVIMEDCGTNIVTLKEFLKQGLATAQPNDITETIGTSLGRFLGAMHAWGRTNPDGLLEVFAKNTVGQHMSAWAFYGRVVSTLSPGEGDVVPQALEDPPLEVKGEDIDVIKRVADQMSKAMTTPSDTFVMGDFWPGNVMVALNAEQQLQRLYILDWEMAKLGLPGVEIGQFCAEMDLLRRFVPVAAGASSKVLKTFLQAYAQELQPSAELARHALFHWGTHLVVFTPRVEWGNKEMTRKVVDDGVRIIVAAARAEERELSIEIDIERYIRQ